MKIQVILNKTTDNMYSCICEKEDGVFKKGDIVGTVTSKTAYKMKEKSESSKKPIYVKINEFTDRRFSKLDVALDASTNWINNKMSIREILKEDEPVKKVLNRKRGNKFSYSLILKSGNIIAHIDRIIYDYYKLPIIIVNTL